MPAATKKRSTSTRLDREAWINAALRQLAEHGIESVRVEQLAAKLGVTKGSFYWHFQDRDELYGAILELWRKRATLDLIDRLERKGDPRARLEKLLRVPFAGRKANQAAEVELSVRLWGRRDDRAKAALEEVDRLRLEYLQQLITASGVPQAEAEARAVVAYSYIRVAPTLVDAQNEALMAQCEAVIFGQDLPPA